MDKTDILLTIGIGSVAGILIINHFVSRSYAAADDDMMVMQKNQKGKKKMMDMKMMQQVVAAKVAAPMCQCPDGTTVQSIPVPGKADQFSCPCMALTGQLGQPGLVGQLGQGVTVVPQTTGVRGNQLQTVPNLMLMPGQVGGLLAGGTALEAKSYAAADVMDMADQDIMDALKNSGIGMAEQKKLLDNLKMQKGKVMMMKQMQNRVTCTCPDGTKVSGAGGICNCGAIQAAGAIGLNRNIAAVPQGFMPNQLGGLQGLQGQVPGQAMPGQRGRMRRGQMQAVPMGGVSPSNTGQVCVLDSDSNMFKLSGTNVPCDPGPGLTMTRDPTLGAIGQSAQTMLAPADKTGASLVSLYGRALLGDSATYGMNKELPLIPCDDEDLYEDYGDLKQEYPITHVQDLVSPYDEDSHTVPFFITEPESFRAVSLLPSNYPRR